MSFSYSIYEPADTPLHNLNPATKFVLAFTVMLAAVVTGSPYALSSLYLLVGLLLATVVLLAASHAKLPALRPFLVSAAFLSLFFSLSWILFTGDGKTVLAGWGPTDLGLLAALNSAVRVFIMVLISALLMYVMSETEFLQALRRLRVPYVISFTLMLALRLLPAIVEDLDYIRQAQMTRGFELQKGRVVTRIFRGMRGLIPLIAILFRRIETLARALESRAFTPRTRGRTAFHEDVLRGRDVTLLTLCAAISLFSLARLVGFFGG